MLEYLAQLPVIVLTQIFDKLNVFECRKRGVGDYFIAELPLNDENYKDFLNNNNHVQNAIDFLPLVSLYRALPEENHLLRNELTYFLEARTFPKLSYNWIESLTRCDDDKAKALVQQAKKHLHENYYWSSVANYNFDIITATDRALRIIPHLDLRGSSTQSLRTTPTPLLTSEIRVLSYNNASFSYTSNFLLNYNLRLRAIVIDDAQFQNFEQPRDTRLHFRLDRDVGENWQKIWQHFDNICMNLYGGYGPLELRIKQQFFAYACNNDNITNKFCLKIIDDDFLPRHIHQLECICPQNIQGFHYEYPQRNKEQHNGYVYMYICVPLSSAELYSIFDLYLFYSTLYSRLANVLSSITFIELDLSFDDSLDYTRLCAQKCITMALIRRPPIDTIVLKCSTLKDSLQFAFDYLIIPMCNTLRLLNIKIRRFDDRDDLGKFKPHDGILFTHILRLDKALRECCRANEKLLLLIDRLDGFDVFAEQSRLRYIKVQYFQSSLCLPTCTVKSLLN